jgi:hypothetical protein
LLGAGEGRHRGRTRPVPRGPSTGLACGCEPPEPSESHAGARHSGPGSPLIPGQVIEPIDLGGVPCGWRSP